MATRLPDPGNNAAASAPPPAAAPAADEVAILMPDVPLVVGGRSLVVREYRFGESLEVSAMAAPLIADIARAIADAVPRYDQVRPLFAGHRELVLALVARAADVEPGWVAQLGRAEGELLVNTWFTVNCGFFVHEAAVLALDARRHEAAPAGHRSSSPSPAPASADSTSSGGTPNDS